MKKKTVIIFILWTTVLVVLGVILSTHEQNQLRGKYANRVLTIKQTFKRHPIPHGTGKSFEIDKGLEPMAFAEAVKTQCEFDMETISFVCVQKYYDHLLYTDVSEGYGDPFDVSSREHFHDTEKACHSLGFTPLELVQIMELLDKTPGEKPLVLSVSREEDGTISIHTGETNHNVGGAGSIFTIKREGDHWKIINEGRWIAENKFSEPAHGAYAGQRTIFMPEAQDSAAHT